MPSEHPVLKFLRSIKLAVGLLIFLALVSIPSTLIVQKESPEFYIERYGNSAAALIRFLSFDDVFVSPLFIAASGLFFLNLAYCSIWRFIRELRKPYPGRHGPDVLHLGLLFFIIGAVISGTGSDETPVLWMDEGDAVTLPGGGRFTLESFETSFYPDARPKSWVSHGTYRDSEGIEVPVSASVNSPVRLEGVKIYQNSFRPKYSLHLIPRPGTGAPELLNEGERYTNRVFTTIRFSEDGLWFALFQDAAGKTHSYMQGDPLGDAFISGFESRDITGLRLSRDPGVPIVFSSFIPIALGLFLILFEKRKSL